MERRPQAATLTRRRLVAGGAAAAAGVAAAGSGSGPLLDVALADSKEQLLESLVLAAFTLELTGVRTYGVLSTSGILSPHAARLLRRLRSQDLAHARRLKTELIRLGAQRLPPAPEAAAVPGLETLTSEPPALAFALALEQRTLGAYVPVVRTLGRSPSMRTIAATMAAHGQQMVVLRRLADQPPVPSAFENGTQQ